MIGKVCGRRMEAIYLPSCFDIKKIFMPKAFRSGNRESAMLMTVQLGKAYAASTSAWITSSEKPYASIGNCLAISLTFYFHFPFGDDYFS